ncbi:hypothetical protein BJ166DRAFT_150516 [Pestalotiopsis sp. NC0098]|nr:hypothetical protein BJ166DRAFT_150516 [Pestalotiopsis sp. NC0098]
MAPKQSSKESQIQSALFRNVMVDYVTRWGFVVIVTARTPDAHHRGFDAAEKLEEHMGADPDGIDRIEIGLPVLHLRGADFDTARKSFVQWVRDYEEAEGEGWTSDVRNDSFILLDGPALNSVLEGDLDTAWVNVIDAHPPSEEERPGYPGWMRCKTSALAKLCEDIDVDDDGLPGRCPSRDHVGQIPLFDGTPGGRLLETDGPAQDGIVDPPTGTRRSARIGSRRNATAAK